MRARLKQRFADLKAQNRGGLVTFITAGDPNPQTSLALLKSLPAAGADIIEYGMPFTDPVADGPAIQRSSLRALDAGMTLKKTLANVALFREDDSATPIILMGYYNPIYRYAIDSFTADAAKAGVDGLIIVDLPPEENDELYYSAQKHGIDIIHLITPTTDAARLKVLLNKSSGFLYYVSIAGITGTQSAASQVIQQRVAFIREHTDLPVVVGFGVKSGTDVAAINQHADAAVVGSAIVDIIANGHADPAKQLVAAVNAKVNDLARR